MCEALGLDPDKVRRIEIILEAQDVAKIRITLIPDEVDLEATLGRVATFTLTQPDDGDGAGAS